MAKLTHIEDVERRNAAAEEEREMLEAQEALERSQGGGTSVSEEPHVTTGMRVEPKPAQAEPAKPQATPSERAVEFDPEIEATAKAQEDEIKRNADEEADFHGLSSEDSMSGMQIALIVLAAIIFIAAILYVVNSWIHFV